MNRVLEEMFATGTVWDGSGHVHQLQGAISPAQARLLEALCRSEQATTTLEVGLAYGASALAILEGKDQRDGIHYAIDPFQTSQWHMRGAENIRRAGFEDRFVLIAEYDDQALPRLVRDGVCIDFAFIDGDHRLEHTWLDWHYIDQLLVKGGLVAFHDYPLAGVYYAVAAALATGRYERVPRWELQRSLTRRLARVPVAFARAPSLGVAFFEASASGRASTHMPVLRKLG